MNQRPEHTDYHDDGCSLHPACLSCPLPACRYDLPRGRLRTWAQQAILLLLAERGLTNAEIQQEMGISRRVLSRLWRDLREQGGMT